MSIHTGSREEPLRWGDSAVGGFPDLRQLSSAMPTCSKWRWGVEDNNYYVVVAI
ncbi:hypothetical protein [Nostoc sp. PCC 7524]|uniref:hypothetical protein n=1 Tax=Nostoc sp. (strain ATCC 29411 / PCC 7524) TaxID=28072 RepID=UPI00149447CD|nr:hypothetical protein [Nostoc sp. PCC 7524]